MIVLTFRAAGDDIEAARAAAREQYLAWACVQQIGERPSVDDALIAEVTAQPATAAVYAAIDAALVGAVPVAGHILLRGTVDDAGMAEVAVTNSDDG